MPDAPGTMGRAVAGQGMSLCKVMRGSSDSEVSMVRSGLVSALWAALAVCPTVVAAAAPDSRGAQTRRSELHREYDSVTDATFAVATDTQGVAHFTIKVGDFLFEKALASSGDTTIRLSRGKDVVTIAASQSGYQVERGRKRARVDPRSEHSRSDNVRALLLGSEAVRTFKRLAASLEDRDESQDDGPLVVAALVDSALIQILEGEPGAAKRLGKRVTRRHHRGVQPVRALRAPMQFTDCVGNYQVSLLYGWDQYASCFFESSERSWYIREWMERACEFEWVLRSQQYAWQFIGCMALPF